MQPIRVKISPLTAAATPNGAKEPDTTAFEKTKPTIKRKTDLARNDGKVLTENGSLSLIPVFI